jgi:hypothetical protein
VLTVRLNRWLNIVLGVAYNLKWPKEA